MHFTRERGVAHDYNEVVSQWLLHALLRLASQATQPQHYVDVLDVSGSSQCMALGEDK